MLKRKDMSTDEIIKNEVMNDGTLVHLYYSKMYDEYVAYGYSAFIAKEVVPDIVPCHLESYSTEFQMPMVRVNEYVLKKLKGELLLKVEEPGYIQLFNAVALDERQYSDWASILRG